MSVIQDKAEFIAAGMTGPDGTTEVAFDPVTITLIVNVLIGIVKLYIQCRKSHEEATVSMQSPGWLTRRRLWREIKAQASNLSAPTDLNSLYVNVLRVAAGVTVSEVSQMFEEAQIQ